MALEKSRGDIMAELATTADFKAYGKACGTALAQGVALLLIEEELKCQDKKGNYSPGKTAKERSRVQITDASIFKLKDAGVLKSLIDRLAITMGEDVAKLDRRAGRANALFAKVANCTLGRELQQPQRQEAEASYYRATPEAPENVDHEKARAWLTRGLDGDAAAFERVFDKYATGSGGLFLGADDQILTAIWQQLVQKAPPHRLPSLDTAYPSSFAGRTVLNQLLKTNSKVALPPVGRNPLVWQGYALYWFATIMSLQPFPDGNKRIARVVYAILLARAGIPFIAPSDAYGAELAAM